MGLETIITPVRELSKTQVCEMLQLMQTYYLNVTRGEFIRDMKETDVAIILHESGIIDGFSIWGLFSHHLESKQVNIIFSGDTIIEPSHWNSLLLPLAWGHLMLSVLEEYPQELYWFLTSAGYKTYRFLPVFFQEFYPTYIKETPPFEKALLYSLAKRRFGRQFDPQSGIIRASKRTQSLRPSIADITEARRRDKHIAFFEKANPGHVNGDELICITRCHENNLNPFILSQLRRQE